MTDVCIHRLENGRASDSMYLPDMTRRAFVFVLDADGINRSWYLESTTNTSVPDDQELIDEPLVSNANRP